MLPWFGFNSSIRMIGITLLIMTITLYNIKIVEHGFAWTRRKSRYFRLSCMMICNLLILYFIATIFNRGLWRYFERIVILVPDVAWFWLLPLVSFIYVWGYIIFAGRLIFYFIKHVRRQNAPKQSINA